MATILAVTSDHHVGGVVSLCPPEVPLDDGGAYRATKLQRWLWDCWLDFWERVKARRDQLGARLVVVYDGDLVEGHHHASVQQIAQHPEAQIRAAELVFAVARSLEPERTYVIRGTEAHAGPSAATEDRIARWLDAEPDPATGAYSWWHLRLEVDGTLVDFAHHGRLGLRPWTQPNVALNLAAEIWYEHVRDGDLPPAVSFRGHRHRWADTGTLHRVRLIQLPCWSFHGAYGWRVAPERLPDIGGVVAIFGSDHDPVIEPVLYRQRRPKPCKI